MNFRINIVGAAGVGKTSFINRHLNGEFSSEPKADVSIKLYTNVGPVIFELIESTSPVVANGYIIMFDIGDHETYNYALNYLNQIFRPRVLCGNKADTLDISPIDLHYDKPDDCEFYLVSAKGMYNYEKPFYSLCKSLIPSFSGFADISS